MRDQPTKSLYENKPGLRSRTAEFQHAHLTGHGVALALGRVALCATFP
jgi:hypothetical protein